ncbi:ABC transporter permease [Pseudooceanicola lipolyticus]|uniref:ABC transporter permease n=1 Tax=Pseudooceanicola lipolyticus TaxID=2029104 RepID=A0A2M8J797_9RHOB|nr:ABC transporter permease [Pseudooceanicola lipolyticus]PJE38649.1 ABC transporter permease [Pseudooceanicola lipolyticus]
MTNWFERGFGFAVPVLIALVVSALVLLVIGENPIDTFALMATEAFGSDRRFASTLSAATPLLFTAVGTAICFRAGVFNVGVDGAFLIAGLAAVVAGFSLPAGLGWALIPICLAIAAVFGAAWLFVPGWLLAKLDVDEVVSTLMLNFIAVAITGYLVNGAFLSEQSGNNVTPRVHDAAELSRLMPPATLHSGFLIGLVVLVAYAFWVRRTPAGLEGAWVGLNKRFARAVGVSVPQTIILAMVLSGVVAGLGGAAHGLGQLHRFTDGFSAGYGFTGMAVALLGRNTPIGILFGAILFGALASAGTTIQLFSNIPLDLVNIIQGIVMIFAVVELGRITIRRRARA